MKKIFVLLLVLISLNSVAQNISLEFNTTGEPDTVLFAKAQISLGQPYMLDTVKMVKLFITQTKEIAPNDIITRTRVLTAPATVLAVLAFDAQELKWVVNKTALNIILAAYNINITVL